MVVGGLLCAVHELVVMVVCYGFYCVGGSQCYDGAQLEELQLREETVEVWRWF